MPDSDLSRRLTRVASDGPRSLPGSLTAAPRSATDRTATSPGERVDEADSTILLVERLDVGIRMALLGSIAFVTASVLSQPSHPELHLVTVVQVLVLLVLLQILRRRRSDAWVNPIGLAALIVLSVGLAGAAILTHDRVTAPMGLILLPLGTAALLPWSFGMHLWTAAVAAAAMLWNVRTVSGTFFPFGYPTGLSMCLGFVASGWIKYEIERSRAAVAEQQARRQLAEAALRHSEAHFRSLVENVLDVLQILNADGSIRYISPSVTRVFGYTPEEVIGKPTVDFLHPDDVPLVAAAFARSLARPDVPQQLQLRLRHKDGRWLTCESVGNRRLEDPEVGGIVVTTRDVSERKRAEAELHRLTAEVEQQARTLDEILSASPDHVYMFDADGRYTYASRAGARALGLERAAILGKSPADLHLPAAFTTVVSAQRAEVFATGRPVTGETSMPTVDGRRAYEYILSPIHRADGSVGAVVATARDITARKRTEERTTALLDVTKAISGALDLDEVLDRVQQRTAAVLPCDAVVTFYWDADREHFRPIAHYGVPAEFVAAVEALSFRSGEPFGGALTRGETAVLNDPLQHAQLPSSFPLRALVAAPLQVRGRHLGGLVAVRFLSGPPFDAGHAALCDGIARQLAVALEAVELYRAQQEEAAVSGALARASQQLLVSFDKPVLLETLCRVTTDALGCDFSCTLLLDPDADAYLPLVSYGGTPEEWEVMRLLHIPRAAVAALLDRLHTHDVVTLAASEFAGLPFGSVAEASGFTRLVHMALRRGETLIGYQLAGYADSPLRLAAQHERIARGLAQLASLSLDHALLIEELERASRLKSEFVATMSHELRTPLNVILGYADLLADQQFGPVGPEQIDVLQRLERNARELLELINNTLDLSRLESDRLSVHVSETSLRELLEEVDVETHELRYKPSVQFTWRVAADVPRVRTDPLKLKMVLKNLIANALKFTDHGRVAVDVHGGDGVVSFAISDTGIGIAADALAIIFEPFRQADSSPTRRHGGVGLGLYIVRRLLEMLGGSITVESRVGEGSTFQVTLPVSIAAAPATAAMPVKAASA